jgi:hypothetical protein
MLRSQLGSPDGDPGADSNGNGAPGGFRSLPLGASAAPAHRGLEWELARSSPTLRHPSHVQLHPRLGDPLPPRRIDASIDDEIVDVGQLRDADVGIAAEFGRVSDEDDATRLPAASVAIPTPVSYRSGR